MTGEQKRFTTRNDEIERLYRTGEYSLLDLRRRFDISLERVRQICMARGVSINPAGKRLPMKQRAKVKLLQAASETAAERDRLREINAELLEALESHQRILGFLSSVIKSGEPWTRYVEEAYLKACSKIDTAMSKATGEAS